MEWRQSLLWYKKEDANEVPLLPTASGCTESSATTALRMGRIRSACIQQTGSDNREAQNLLDYGFRELFTPDHRDLVNFPEAASSALRSPLENHASTSWNGHGCTALIDDHKELRLNGWAVTYTTNQISPAGFAQKLTPSKAAPLLKKPALVDLVEIPTTDRRFLYRHSFR